MIYSTGIDLVEIDRIQKGYRRYGDNFLNRLYSPDEIGIIKSRKANMIVTMAGKFAAKEAVMKALGYFFDEGVYLRGIEILNQPSGIPYVRLPQKTDAKMAGKKILISISHEKKYAVATAIICDEV
ncbi:MAG: holo-[acyl-carrier-protein] synthase [FCB group bacterium]|nr:holo-[acyl-carrier-protein] synthase [FCB group bacterium]